MIYREVLEAIIDYLRMHRRGSVGYLGQEPYKGDLFKLFAKAYNAGLTELDTAPPRELLTGDALGSVIMERAPEFAEGGEEVYFLTQKWDEWRYAWKHVDMLDRLPTT